MKDRLNIKLDGMFWDLPESSKKEMVNHILTEPYTAFQDEQLFIRSLNSLTWYEMVRLIGIQNLQRLLSEKIINKLYPVQRRIFYSNARKLLSKYSISFTGQNS